ncbi:hypothetical protein PF002_g19614, partial [Phytophthora fragariae]
PGFPFISVLLTLVLVIEMLLPSGLSSLLEWSALRYCGKVSFSIYLLHGFVMYAEAVGAQANYYDRFFASFGPTILLATVSYHRVQRQSLGNTKATEMATDGVHVDSAQSKAMNLQVLKRQGADVMEIMDTASHVVMYECDILYTLAT